MRHLLLLPLALVALAGCVNVQKDPAPATTTYVTPAQPTSTTYVTPGTPYSPPSTTTVYRNP
jgi:hypothetical protein